MSAHNQSMNLQRILARVAPHEFVGRTDELARIIAHATAADSGRGILLLLEPSAGVSELLRQAYDQIFLRKSDVVPIYFAFSRNDPTAVSAAIEFLNAFLQQYVAFRRDEPALCRTAVTLQDLVALTPAPDLEWVEQLVESYNRLRFSNDDRALIRFCLAAPQRLPARLGRTFVMLDGAELAEQLNGVMMLGPEVVRVFGRSGSSFVLAGPRRQILEAAHDAELNFETLDLLRLQQLPLDDSRLLVERVAQRNSVVINDEVRDLVVQQFGGSPLFITTFLQAAREKNVQLDSYLNCERLYVDEVFGGFINRHYADLLEETCATLDSRLLLIRLLWEADVGDGRITSFETWRKRLLLANDELEYLLHRLHVQEFVNWDGATVEAGGGPIPWKDYLKIRYRLDIINEPRALVFADALADSLKRAPHTMARHYKHVSRIGLAELLSRFNCQRVPQVLFDYQAYRAKYRGVSDDEAVSGVEGETELFRLPQTVHVASCLAFNPEMRQVCERDRCVVAHSFAEGSYVDAQEVVWLVAEIESKLEVDVDDAQIWHDRFEAMAASLNFGRYQIWLISNEGFSEEASKALHGVGTFTSSRKQVELLSLCLGDAPLRPVPQNPEADEYLVVVPMGENNELIAAMAVEQIARRLSFEPEAINQIKTAIVEACINASEHSYSPERKIYQRFLVENDKLVVTVSSRGIVPPHITNKGGKSGSTDVDTDVEERRGWGLKLIRTLMDEVEFERVDDGTSLRMTKYLRHSSS